MRKIRLLLIMMVLPFFSLAQQEVKRDTFYFDVDSDIVKLQYQKKLQMQAGWIAREVDKIILTGHTDTDGSGIYNTRLGLRRAEAVKKLLLALNIKCDIATNTKGETEPVLVYGGKSEEDKAKSRRVEIAYYYTPKLIEEETVVKEIPNDYTITINVTEAETGATINALVAVQANGRLFKSFDGNSSYNFKAKVNKPYQLHVTADGYQSKVTDARVVDKSITLDVVLYKLVISKKLTFENINFVGDSAIFLEESYDELNSLLKTMRDNPEIKIEIQGHVNAPFKQGQTIPEYISPTANDWYYWLSLERAKAVYTYLVENGIDPNRMTYKGLGNSKMLYPFATSEKEQKLNRRVEVYILEE